VINSRKKRWAVHVARVGDRRDANRRLMETPHAKKTLGRPRHRWKSNIEINLQEVGCEHAVY
jgi:hypothetical protein